MTLLENLQSHKGSLLRLKTELFWYGGRGWDGNPGRICLLLDVCPTAAAVAAEATAGPWATTAAAAEAAAVLTAAALLLIDGSPRWIWMVEADVDVIDETR